MRGGAQLLGRTLDGQWLDADTMATTPTTTREPPRFGIEILDQAGVRVIAVSGELDIATAAQFQSHLQDAGAGGGAVLADLCAVGFIDSTGVRSLWQSHNSITGQGRRFAVCCRDSAPAKRVLTLTGLDRLVAHYPDRVTAIDALRG